jgi:TonB family protein
MANETIQFAGAPATARPPRPLAHFGFEPSDNTPLTPVLTLVAWVVCLAVGLLGFVLPYARPHQSVNAPQSVKVERLVVELSKEPAAPGETERLPGPRSSVPLPADAMAPPPIAVAQPSAAIAFAVPVEGPTRVVPFNQATYAKPPQVAPVQRLTFGEGEGRQLSPEYPQQAIQQHQEGLVVVRLKVAESGQVSSAEAIQPCPWPLLNESALRTVRYKWRFSAGDVRIYDVAIRFQITNQ